MSAPERSAERDAAIVAMLPLVGVSGWTVATVQAAAGPDADLLFPGGAPDMVEAFCDLGDRWMAEDAAASGVVERRVSERVRSILAARFERNEPYKEAVRRGLGVLAGHPVLTARCTARTVDAVWDAAGDEARGFGWYSKRAILTGVYGATLLFWLRDESGGGETLDFLDRRLAAVGQIGRLRKRLRRAG